MPDGITPVGAQIKPPDMSQGMATMSGILGLQQQRQQIGIQGAELQKAQQLQGERQRIAQMMSSGKDDQGNSIIGADGNPDVSRVLPALGRIAPLSGQDMAQNILKTHTDSVGLKAAALGLNASERQLVSGPVRSLIGTPGGSKELQEALTPLVEQNPDLKPTAGYALRLAQQADGIKDPKARDNAWLHIAQQFQSPSEVAAAQSPNVALRQGPTGAQPVQTNPQAPGGIGDVGNALPQGIAPQIVTYPNSTLGTAGAGQGGIANGGGRGGPPGSGAPPSGPRTAAQDAPPPNAPAPVQQAYADAVKGANAHVDEVRHNDSDYGVNRHINQQILKLSDSTDTGPGTEVWHHALGAVAGPFGGNNVADYQTIGAYLDRQAALSTRQMGLPDTNAGLATAASLSGTTGYQKGALQTKVKLTDALVEGAHQYRVGLDKIAGAAGQASPQAVQQYRSAWAANFDPTVYLFKNASPAERKVIASHLSPEQAAQLKQKAQALDALAQGQQ